jgi:hypothetical protein
MKVNSWHWQEVFLFSKTSRWAVGQLPGFFSQEKSGKGKTWSITYTQ